MKKVILIAVVAAVFAACGKEEEEGFKFDSNKKVTIQGVDNIGSVATARGTLKRANGEHKTAAEIVRIAANNIWNIELRCEYDADAKVSDYYKANGYGRPFSEPQIDTINNRFYMWGTDILHEDLTLEYQFIDGINFYIAELYPESSVIKDTLAYIPNSVVLAAREQIYSLHAQGRYSEIYELFDNAYRFYPCTGEEYKQIIANGGN